MMQTFLSIAFSLVLAWGCARRRARNPTMRSIFWDLCFDHPVLILPVLKAADKKVAVELPSAFINDHIPFAHREIIVYYLDEQKKQFGPMSFNALNKAWNEGALRERTFVWNEAMENWQHLKDVIQLQPSCDA